MHPGRFAPWIQLFIQILETSLGQQFEAPIENTQQIEAMNKQPVWQLKGIVAQITLKLYQK